MMMTIGTIPGITKTITDMDRICDKMAEILNIPSDYDLVCFLPIGIAEDEAVTPKKKAFEERAWFNSFPAERG